MKKPIYAALLLAGASLGLAACGGGSADEPAAEAGAETIEGLEISDARLVLPPVAGNPAAIYFELANNSDRNLAFRSAEVEKAARAEVHDSMEYDGQMVMGEAPPILVEAGGKETFAPGGKHVMAFELAEGFAAGDTTKVTLIVAGGKRHTFEASARAAGDDR
ncbi:copper chaperone PCu(A)C [Qipengyuania vesicularis]|uniref:copper chaperone PCu(A)C n=1 Tax=Qipengyuania vesicularis TaxID=2867232 RepID=UPI001C889312|nr:copper chaperone PCu(A)C [Qipengyuania vesicularis]MBX7526791.1 copper chaperone PCu(A)C [Qipengyuania vesicularis]